MKFSELGCDEEIIGEFRECSEEVFSKISISDFISFMEELSAKQTTVRFWYQFITKDGFAHVSLYIAIRYRMWNLRVASLKLMAPVFQPFDRPIYHDCYLAISKTYSHWYYNTFKLKSLVYTLHHQTGMQ